ncbi:MAG TPA: DUF4328 domain-containing protein [Polyangiaceae bacterium]|nr:DUF4328 domain-containing protein [Polyangiaceae bacterium]
MNANDPYAWPTAHAPQNVPGGYPPPQPFPGYGAAVPIAYGPGARYGYVPLGWRTPVASVALVLTGVFAIVSGLLQQGDLHPESTDPDNLVLALGVLLSAVAYLGSLALAAILFSIWIYRACANAWAFGSPMSITPGWAVGWFFVPFANLVKPFRAMKEIWFGSDPSAAGITPGVLGAWWGTWIISGIVWNVSSRIDGSHLEVVAGLLTAVAAVFAVLVMRRVAANQRRLADGRNPAWP